MAQKPFEEYVVRLRLPISGLVDALTDTMSNIVRHTMVSPDEWEDIRECIHQRFDDLTHETSSYELQPHIEVCINVKTLETWVELSDPEDENWRPQLFRKWDRIAANALEEELECTCHERDSSYTCDACKSEGFYGHMETIPKSRSLAPDQCGSGGDTQ